MTAREVHYSVVVGDERRQELLVRQLLHSIGTLRRHDDRVAVVVDWSGRDAPGLFTRLRMLHVEVRRFPSYRDLLAGWEDADLLADYPVLFKYVASAAAFADGAEQVLLLDCDTHWNGGADAVFAAAGDRELVGVPDWGTRAAGAGYDPGYLDEDRLAAVAAGLGAAPAATVNGGLLLWSRQGRAPDEFARLGALVVELTVRLLAGIVESPDELASPFLHRLRERRRLQPAEPGRALPYPSSNHWIAEEVALWLALGLTGFRAGYFDAGTAVVGTGVFARPAAESGWIVGHYFTSNTEAFERWSTSDAGPASAGSSRAESRSARRRGHVHERTLPLDPELADSPLVRQHRGAVVIPALMTPEELAAIRQEAHECFWAGREQLLLVGNGGLGRGAHPARKLVYALGGPIQREFFHSERLGALLHELVGPVRRSDDLGTFNYYTRAGDFMGLHLDVQQCDLVVLTVLQDDGDPADAHGAYRLFPGHIGVALPEIGEECESTAVTLKVAPGDSLVMFGGLVPHRVLPIAHSQIRIASALCFRAVTAQSVAQGLLG